MKVPKDMIIPRGDLAKYPPKIKITGMKMSATETDLFNLHVLGLDDECILKLPPFAVKGNVYNYNYNYKVMIITL